MADIDPQLIYLKQQSEDAAANEAEGENGKAVAAQDEAVGVLLHFTGSLEPVIEAGFRPSTVAGDMAAGLMPLSSLDVIAAMDDVLLIEASRPLKQELD